MTAIDRRKFTVLSMTALTTVSLPLTGALGKMTQGTAGRLARDLAAGRVHLASRTPARRSRGRRRLAREQRVHVYRNGIRIAVSTCSTGKPGPRHADRRFHVLQKDKDHRSSTYNNAPMPNTNRLTWDGIALHAGNLPGYPASHGCVRLPLEFSALLFEVTHLGTPVIIADDTTSRPRWPTRGWCWPPMPSTSSRN